jgi:UDP-2,3-diacylglucosamine hydrolase
MDRDAVYFVSDAHFGLNADERAKTEKFSELAAEMRERAADVFLVGDMFDFWIEYRSAIRRDYFLVLHELRRLVEAGVRVHYIKGNHDFAMGAFLEETVGVLVHHSDIDIELSGRKVRISHGEKVKKNSIFKIINALMRNRPLQALYRLIHPDIGVLLGKTVSATSKTIYSGREPSPDDANRYRRAAAKQLKNGECDLVIMAHTHHADFVNSDDGDYCNTGSWMANYDYAVLRGGQIQLMTWKCGNSAS